jgi:hypothetical protein
MELSKNISVAGFQGYTILWNLSPRANVRDYCISLLWSSIHADEL